MNLCHNRAEVGKILKLIDMDNCGEIQFDQFLALIKTAQTLNEESPEEVKLKPNSSTLSKNTS
jgi:Ca2+-binding EF-hand superfamily protein